MSYNICAENIKNYEYVEGRYDHKYRIMVPIYEMADAAGANVVADADAATVVGSAAEGAVVLPATASGSEGEVPVTAIADYAFMGNGAITSVDIPASVGSAGAASAPALRASATASATAPGIGKQAFAYCMNMDTVRVHWTEPLAISADVFEGIDLAALTLIVPEGTTALYAADDVWKKFGAIVASDIPEGIDVFTPDVSSADDHVTLRRVNLLGQPVNNACQGIVIVNGRKTVVR